MMLLERMSWGSVELKSVKRASHPVLQEALAVIEWNLYKKATLHNMSAMSVAFSTPMSIISL